MGLIYQEVVLTEVEHNQISKLVYDRFGIVLNDKKKGLVAGRLQKILRQKGFTSFKDYYQFVVNDTSGQELQLLIDKLSTNHTYFFREEAHFDFLKEKVLPELLAGFAPGVIPEIRIWSGAASTGEEIYTLKMVVEEFSKAVNRPINVKILGTDISGNVLESAIEGVYPAERLEKLPKHLISKYFHKQSNGDYAVVPRLKENIIFKKLNLMNPEYPFKNKFHIIFLHNVIIYFDDFTKASLVKKMHRYLADGGYFFIGLAETIGQNNPHFKYLQPSVYKKK